MKRSWTDLAGAAALALVSAIAVIALPGAHLLRAVFAVLLVAVLPGYSLTAVLFGGRQIDWPRRALLVLGLSLSASIVVSVALNLFPSALRSWTWAIALLVVTCAGCALAAEQRYRAAVAGRAEPALSIPRVRLRNFGVALTAVVLFGTAVAFARAPLAAKDVEGYSAVWLLPGPPGKTTSVGVGVSSAEKVRKNYRLVLRTGNTVVYRRRLTLAPSGNYATVVKLGGRRRVPVTTVVASLYLNDRPTALYRMAKLTLHRAKTR
jgi:uncharacterized membrane protein